MGLLLIIHEKIDLVFFKFLQKIEERSLPYSFYESFITLVLKPNKNST